MTDQTILTVGVGEQYATINAAIVAADQMGGNADIKVDAGTYTNDGGYLWDGVSNVTIEGVGGMATIVDPTYYAGGKAAIVVGGSNILLRNLDISGVAVPDGNGAGIRYDQGTLTLDNVHLHNNQNGILGAADANGTITITNSEIDHNGTSAGNTHNIYIGDVAQFTLTNSYIHDANVGHEVKSRAENNTIINNRILDNNGTSSYAIDLPNGGNATITNNVIEQGANNQNHVVNAYGEEGNLHAGTAVTFSNNEVVNDDPNGAGPLWNNNGATITGSANTAWNLANLGNIGTTSVTALASRPTLDTSSELNIDPNAGDGTGGSSTPDLPVIPPTPSATVTPPSGSLPPALTPAVPVPQPAPTIDPASQLNASGNSVPALPASITPDLPVIIPTPNATVTPSGSSTSATTPVVPVPQPTPTTDPTSQLNAANNLAPALPTSSMQTLPVVTPAPDAPVTLLPSGSVLAGNSDPLPAQANDLANASMNANAPASTASSSPASVAPDNASSLSPQGDAPVPNSPQPTYRFFDTVNGTQFLTSSETERDNLLQDPSKFTYEGHGMNSVTMDPDNPNVASVFRFFNTTNGTHFFTTSAGERDTILATRSDLIQEQANFAEHLQAQAGDTAVYRFFDSHSGDHFFTQSAAEHATIVATRPDMISEGVAFYAPNQT